MFIVFPCKLPKTGVFSYLYIDAEKAPFIFYYKSRVKATDSAIKGRRTKEPEKIMLSTFYPHYVYNLRKLHDRKIQILLDVARENTYNVADVFSTYMTACI